MLSGIDLKKPVAAFPGIIEKYIYSTDQSDFILIISPQYSDSFRALLAELKTIRPSLLWINPCSSNSPEVSLEPSISDSYMRWEVAGNE